MPASVLTVAPWVTGPPVGVRWAIAQDGNGEPLARGGLRVVGRIRSTFALLFVVIVAVPFRRGQRWAWWAAWIVMIADLGYTFTFGIRDHVILARSRAVDVALAVLLLAHVPVFFARAGTAHRAGPG